MSIHKHYQSLSDQARALPAVIGRVDLCRLFGVTQATIYRESRAGWRALPPPLPRVARCCYRWLREDVIRWLEEPAVRRIMAQPASGSSRDLSESERRPTGVD